MIGLDVNLLEVRICSMLNSEIKIHQGELILYTAKLLASLCY
jgi:hypothetical protein